MMPSHATQITFQVIRGGRFSAILSPRVAAQLADAVMTLSDSDMPARFDRESLKNRLLSGQPVSQGDMLSLVRFRALFKSPGSEAMNALQQVERFVIERTDENARSLGSLRNPFHPIFVLPPRPSADS
jgi:hypothetical protein